MMSYVSKSTHKHQLTYKVNLELDEYMTCKRCGETIVPFDCGTYDVNPDIRYVDIGTFQQLAKEIAEIKKYILDFNNINITQE